MQTQSNLPSLPRRQFGLRTSVCSSSLLLLGAFLITVGSNAQAQSGAPITWSGNSSVSAWTSAPNWVGGVLPVNSIAFGTGNRAVFSDANPNQMPTVSSARSIYGVRFTATGYTIHGGDNVLSIGGGGIELTANVTAQINTALLGASQSYSIAENSTLITTRAINNNGGLSKIGAGTWEIRDGTLNASSGFAINGGSVIFGADNRISASTDISLSNATLDLNSYTSTTGTLVINGNGFIDFGSTVTTSSLVFADSSAQDWSLGSLTIRNYKAGDTLLRFGVDSAGLTEDQLSLITFEGFGAGAKIDALGYIAPIPESSTVSLLIGASACAAFMLRKRRKACR